MGLSWSLTCLTSTDSTSCLSISVKTVLKSFISTLEETWNLNGLLVTRLLLNLTTTLYWPGYNKSNPIMNIFWFSERTQRSSLCFTFSFPFWNVPDILKLIFPQTFGVNLKQELEDVNINYIQINFPYFFEKQLVTHRTRTPCTQPTHPTTPPTTTT